MLLELRSAGMLYIAWVKKFVCYGKRKKNVCFVIALTPHAQAFSGLSVLTPYLESILSRSDNLNMYDDDIVVTKALLDTMRGTVVETLFRLLLVKGRSRVGRGGFFFFSHDVHSSSFA